MITYVWPPQSVAVAVPPVQYLKNGANQTVAQDTVTPANNNPLPAGMYILKDGIAYPVGIDTVTPSNTVSVPVRVEGATGPINITAGDLNVQLSDAGANYDATRIGDGSGIYLKINADGSVNVSDATTAAKLTSLLGLDFATSAKQDAAKTVLDNSLTKLTSIDGKDFSTSAKQDLAKAVLDNIKTNGDTLNAKDFATSAKQDAQAVLTGAVTETAPASDTASSGLNGRLQRIAQRLSSLIALLPTSLGQKTKANSLAVAIASDQDPLATVPSTLSLTVAAGSALNADVIPQVDVSNYKVLFVHVLNSFVGTITFQGSMDGINWVSIQASPQSSPSTVANTNFSGSNGATLSIFTVPVVSKYFRLRLTAYTSGICNVVGVASSTQTFDYATKYFAANAPFLTTPTALTPTYQEDLAVTDASVKTFTAPASAKWCKIQADNTNSGNARVKLGGTASVTSGFQMDPGRSEDFEVAGNISYTMETGGSGKIYVQFGA